MVAVLLVLMALFVLSAPFLVTVRNADQASAESSDRSVLRVTLDSAGRHGAAVLAGSHPALDPTPYADDLEELRVTSRFPEGFLATDDPKQVMWDLAAEDVAARIDLASASPHVFANLIGGATRLAAKVKDEKDKSIEVSDTEGFLPEGVVMVDDELMGYAELEPTKLGKLVRGLLVKLDAAGNPAECGPTPGRPHEIGAFVIDQRAWALCEWRIAPNYPNGKLRAYDGIEQVREASDFMLAKELGREAYLALERTTSTHGHVRAGAVWQRAARVVGDPIGEPQYGCKLPVDDVRWFNPGTTVWVTDGTNSEYALVRDASGGASGGTLVLTEALRAPFEAFETIVSPLARTPVNVNTAGPEVLEALWTNLKLRGKSARITAGEAEKLVEVALVSRPFTGFEDFLRRLVLPAAGLDELPADAPVRPEALEELGREAKLDANGVKQLAGFIDPDDARALYKNSLNANDNELEFSTMPLTFTSRDVYELELRASVNAPSGVERARGRRELVELIVPQKDLLTLWTRQEDFDEAPRLDLAAAGWMSGPVPTSRYDARYGEIDSMRWPTRARAHLGPHDTHPALDPLLDTTRVYCFAERDGEDGWAQLAPYREEAQARKASYALHFDDETKELEGRYLPDGAAPLDLAKLGWSGTGSLMRGMAASLWVKPRELEEGARLLDVAGQYSDSDRLSLMFEGGNLVLRVLDGAGDHPNSTFKERAEITFPLSGEGAGFPKDTWSHVQVAVEGTRPEQMALWLDGNRADHTPGMTRLTGAITSESNTIPVESTEGFPDKCVLRIGDELIEATKKGEKSFTARFNLTGEDAGFGGRIAREIYDFQGGDEMNSGLTKFTDHPSGSTVQLYGYSLLLSSNVPNVASALSEELAMFAVARVEGVVIGGSEKRMSAMEPIQWEGDQVTRGYGFDGLGDDLTGLLLQPVDPGRSLEDTMATFSESGGYAAILGPWKLPDSDGNTINDINGTRVGGFEVIRYSGWDGQTLQIQTRGGAGLKRLKGTPHDTRASFIVYYDIPVGWTLAGWEEHNDELDHQVMVIPISLPVRGSGGGTGFDPANNGSAYVQLTRTGSESHLTEWVRYDEISTEGFLVRSDPTALEYALLAAHSNISVTPGTAPTRILASSPPSGPGTLVPEPAGGRAGAAIEWSPQQSGRGSGAYWDYVMGEPDDEDFPVARSVNSYFQFRGVMGTYVHEQPAGTMVLPVFTTRNDDQTAGWPGRFDHVMFMSSEPSEPGFPGTVHHAHRPWEYPVYDWQNGSSPLSAMAVETVASLGQDDFETHVALDDRLEVPFTYSQHVDDDANPIDNRLLARMVLFPSGELPREVLKGQLGGDAYAEGGRSGGGAVPSATVDEALFFPSYAAELSGMTTQLVLAQAFGESDKSFSAMKDTVRTTLGDFTLDDPAKYGGPTQPGAAKPKVKTPAYLTLDPLAKLPPKGGLLRIGDELLCYDSWDRSGNAFSFTIPPAGRGLLGTDAQPHRPTESVSYVGSLPLGVLGTDLGADDSEIPLLEPPVRFPSHGTVRIEDELVHFARNSGGVLSMPRASAKAGEMDRRGPGLFRGRFGTERTGHGAGTPVILFPFRYWDRWSELADAPEMTYYELACEQPDAYWKRVFWKAADPGHPGPQLGVLQRTNQATPWDAPAEDTNGLQFLWEGKLEGEGNPISVQTDRVEWRVFVRHLPGSFDARDGLAHGWKTTPRLELFGVEYMGPSRTLARIDR